MTERRAQSLFRGARVTLIELSPGRYMLRLFVKDRPARWDEYRCVSTTTINPPVQPTSIDDVARMIAAVLLMEYPDAR